jgi:hypothetical protein
MNIYLRVITFMSYQHYCMSMNLSGQERGVEVSFDEDFTLKMIFIQMCKGAEGGGFNV